MILYGVNVAAFKLPIHVPSEIWDECQSVEECFLPHNFQLGESRWGTVSIKSALGNWRLTDPPFYRDMPEFKSCSGMTIDDRLEYMKQWAYTEIAAHCPVTTRFCQDLEDLGSFMSGARFLKVPPKHLVRWHQDNNPHKEFRITVGLKGMEDEEFVINNGQNKMTVIPTKAFEVWFVDVGLGHAVKNTGTEDRYRLGMQFYGPTSDWFLELFKKCDRDSIIYADQLRVNAPFEGEV